jgi:leucine dehydrogenase
MLRALGRAIDELGGRYLAAEDVGASQADMDVLAQETPWVTGVDPAAGGSGDPSPVTAIGVVAAMRAVARALDGDPSITGYTIAVQGVGHVGTHLVADLVQDGADVVVADVNADRAARVAADHGARVVAPGEILTMECDVLAPCALGPVIDGPLVSKLRCRAVCGAANNQLADETVDDALCERGIVYAPDFVANAGGIINIAQEFVGYSHDRAVAQTQAIEQTMSGILERARAERRGPGRVADAMARERIAREGAGRRWRPGDPTAWTDGEPLRRLRPPRA